MSPERVLHPSVTDFFAKDHDRLDLLFKNYREMKRTNRGEAKKNFVQFKFGLQRHIIWEEEILFAIYESKTGMRDVGPTAVMRKEHRLIGRALEAIHGKVGQGNPDTEKEEQDLLDLLSPHNIKEEKILYPAIDSVISPQELSSVFQKMESLPPERYEKCC
ncbi:MAG: hemerythrin domain-containing protein [Deltaproteobacteria bacterium]|nr:hemerythrin domain-containing protein [Deltaproteobacteria bacterium]